MSGVVKYVRVPRVRASIRHVPIRAPMRQCDLCYLLSARPARAFPDCTSSAHRPCIDRTRSASEKRPPTAAPATPVTHGPQSEQPPNARGLRIEFRASRNSSRRTRPHTPRIRDYRPIRDTLRGDAASSRPRLLTLETATPHTDEHHDISPIAPPSRNSSPHTAKRNKACSTHCPRKKLPDNSSTAPRDKRSPQHRPSKNGRSPHRRTQQATPRPLQRTTQRKAATAPSPGPGKPQAAPCRRTTRPARPQTIRPSSKPAGPNRTTSRYKRKSARTERSVCADLHRVQGNPCGDITSSCRRWSSWRPSEPKPSLRQPSGPSERQPSWVRPF